MNAVCLQCYLKKHAQAASALGDEETATAFIREALRQFVDAPADVDSAHLGGLVNPLYTKYFNTDPDRFREEKELSNRFVLERLEDIRRRVEETSDPVFAGLQFSILGNYLDFSALGKTVSFEKLDDMLTQALEMELDMQCYQKLRQDLEKGKKLLYLTDNAGEIGFDRIFAEILQKTYPHLQITFCVRGGPIANDATREDAELMEIPFPVIDSGNAIGGTVISKICPEAKKALEEADVIIAKGMGNTESMYGCGYNVYYAFLVKCDRFIQFFDKPFMTPMLIKDNG